MAIGTEIKGLAVRMEERRILGIGGIDDLAQVDYLPAAIRFWKVNINIGIAVVAAMEKFALLMQVADPTWTFGDE